MQIITTRIIITITAIISCDQCNLVTQAKHSNLVQLLIVRVLLPLKAHHRITILFFALILHLPTLSQRINFQLFHLIPPSHHLNQPPSYHQLIIFTLTTCML